MHNQPLSKYFLSIVKNTMALYKQLRMRALKCDHANNQITSHQVTIVVPAHSKIIQSVVFHITLGSYTHHYVGCAP